MKINIPSKSKKISEVLAKNFVKKDTKEGVDLASLAQKVFERQRKNLKDNKE